MPTEDQGIVLSALNLLPVKHQSPNFLLGPKMRHSASSPSAPSTVVSQSLPTSILKDSHKAMSEKPSKSNISEARGLIVDMLANRDLPPNVTTCLRAVAQLLNTQSTDFSFTTPFINSVQE
ncbi:hypothetical protein FO519_004719 [Halicephalobus sp. NKZ332]|nr:hypothetical protein FO519_004719 [Halicephalobus sp. NKZ332]